MEVEIRRRRQGVEPCGCSAAVGFEGMSSSIEFCPLHKAAGKLLEACKEAKRFLNSCEYVKMLWPGVPYPNLDAAILEAEGNLP